MIKAAIVALKDRSGSSSVAIGKYIAANFKLPANFPKYVWRKFDAMEKGEGRGRRREEYLV